MKFFPFIFLNPNSLTSKKVISYFNKKQTSFFSTKKKDFSQILLDQINKGQREFLICGGDGTLNNFINNFMKLKSNKRKKVILSILPCGKANDLARELNIPLNIEEIFDGIYQTKIKNIDLIRVNSNYFVTGGGLGLPTQVIESLNASKSRKVQSNLMNDFVYYFQII